MGAFELDGVGVGDGLGVDVCEVVGSEGVWVGGGDGDESLKGVKPDKETAKKAATNAVETKTATTTYCFFMMELQYNFKFIC
jgi:hypothetical protein